MALGGILDCKSGLRCERGKHLGSNHALVHNRPLSTDRNTKISEAAVDSTSMLSRDLTILVASGWLHFLLLMYFLYLDSFSLCHLPPASMTAKYCSLSIADTAENATRLATECATTMTDVGGQNVTIGEPGLQGMNWVATCSGFFTEDQRAQLEAMMTDEWCNANADRVMGLVSS